MADIEELESPIPSLPHRPREAHSQQSRQQQWERQRRRFNSCHPQGCHPPTFRACISLVLSQQATYNLSDTSQHPPINSASSKATLAIISADTRNEARLQNFHCCLEKDGLISAACRVTSNMYTQSRLQRELLPFNF